jgi:MFS family permease
LHEAGAGIVQGLRQGFATQDLRRLQLGWAAASVGGWAFMVALSVYAYGEGGAPAVGLAALVRMLPAGLAAPLTGLLADRYSRRDVLVVTCAGRGVALAAIAWAVAVDAPLALVLGLAAAITVLQTAHRPAQAALLPVLARTPRELAAANAVWSAVDNGGFLVGALLGGALIATAGTAAVFGVSAFLLVVAAAALARIARDDVPEHRSDLKGLRELGGGVRALRSDRTLALVSGVVAATTLVEGMVDVLVVVAALTLLDLGDAGVGWLNGAWGVGGLVGGFAALMLLHRGLLSAGLAGGAVLAGLALLALAALPGTATGLVLFAAFGVGYALVEIAELTLAQRLASDELLARAFGVTECLYWITTGIGAIAAPALIAWLGVRGALAVAGAALIVLVALSGRALARIEHGRPVPERGFELLRGVGFLAPVPLATLENLALRLAPVGVTAGEDAVREGEPGERFYVIDSGALDVHAGGRALARLGPGDCFGEIALLRGVPRTATVTAVEPAQLQALGRDEFLAAVTGQPRAAQAAERFAAQRINDPSKEGVRVP